MNFILGVLWVCLITPFYLPQVVYQKIKLKRLDKLEAYLYLTCLLGSILLWWIIIKGIMLFI